MIERTLLNNLSNAKEIELILDTSPQYVRPFVTQNDADNGFITRYFVRQTNDQTFIVEVDRNQYAQFKQNPRFLTTEIKWKIVGKLDTITLLSGANLYGVKDVNRITVADTDLTFGGLRSYISDYAEFWLRE
jgi:hypothetical protein